MTMVQRNNLETPLSPSFFIRARYFSRFQETKSHNFRGMVCKDHGTAKPIWKLHSAPPFSFEHLDGCLVGFAESCVFPKLVAFILESGRRK
jgi:hypothetical protein